MKLFVNKMERKSTITEWRGYYFVLFNDAGKHLWISLKFGVKLGRKSRKDPLIPPLIVLVPQLELC